MSCIDHGIVQTLCKRLFAEDDGAVRAVQRGVRWECHDVGSGNGRGQQPCGNEAHALPDVHPKGGAHGMRDFGEFCVIRNARIADRRKDQQTGAYALGTRHDGIPIDRLRIRGNTEVFKGIVQPCAVLQLAQVEGEHAVACLQ